MAKNPGPTDDRLKEYIPRKHERNLIRFLKAGRVMVLYGPRRAGKTTLVKRVMEELDEGALYLTGEDIFTRQALSSQSVENLRNLVGENKLVVIDEAQHVPKIGLNLKLLVDHVDGLKIVATGSSSFELARDVGEPLTGRKITLTLFPLAQDEIAARENRARTRANLECRLVYGTYPEVVTASDDKERELFLREMVGSYLLKDILAYDGVRHSDKLVRLLQLLALQVGKEVSCAELGQKLGMSKNTVDRYLDLLERVFVIHRLTGFSRNLRKEITKNNRCFFYDNGIRNALINNFNGLHIRDDIGMLWENYIITERRKLHENRLEPRNMYFWRTYDQKEVDLIEESGGRLSAFEIKWSRKKSKVCRLWEETYPGSSVRTINSENYLSFIT